MEAWKSIVYAQWVYYGIAIESVSRKIKYYNYFWTVLHITTFVYILGICYEKNFSFYF